MQAYRVTGIAPFGKQRQKFSIDIPAKNAEEATHFAYSILGSRHNAKRRKIEINSVDKIDPSSSSEPRIRSQFREEIAKYSGATFDELDIDGDGTLSKAELDIAEEISEEDFKEMDADGDGSISKDEFEAAAEKEEE